MGKLLPLEKLGGGQGERAAAAKDDLPSAPVPIGVLRCALGEGALATERARRSLAMASFGFPCGPARQVKVSAGVVMSVLDAYVRRNEGQERVVGTLLGSLNAESGTVDVRNVYAVPHNESKEQVALDIEFHRTALVTQNTAVMFADKFNAHAETCGLRNFPKVSFMKPCFIVTGTPAKRHLFAERHILGDFRKWK